MEELLIQFPVLSEHKTVAYWLHLNDLAGLTHSTQFKYAWGLADYLKFCQKLQVDHLGATQEHTSLYRKALQQRTWCKGHVVHSGLAKATMRQRMSILKLYYTYLKEEGMRDTIPLRTRNPWSHNHNAQGNSFGDVTESEVFWIPDTLEWNAIVEKIKTSSLRNELMLMLAYEAALRREEVCSLQIGDLDQNHLLLTVRKETTKNNMQRIVPISAPTHRLFAQYLALRPFAPSPKDPLFLSNSRSNKNEPITIWTWSKVIRATGLRTGLLEFRTHTMRHLRITHLVQAGVDLYTIAKLVGHKNPATTMRYTHLRPEQLAVKVRAALDAISLKFGNPLQQF
ncbi:site-specific integrase [Hymenobacter sp. GOD-10R]|uniref:tyrosine-type recombinase/integrase n=1 Tax=Hymenobacter sp. GOD-10R TaxID=3093922 RepID=UPI002D77C114|nr:site-specific integrase [Hymenobacter sp. GOD-10R]WRQ31899.1 site-specific integrase [Hymenobacter sp. GOD-10R]